MDSNEGISAAMKEMLCLLGEHLEASLRTVWRSA